MYAYVNVYIYEMYEEHMITILLRLNFEEH